MSSYASVDHQFPGYLTARLGAVNAEAVVVGEGGQGGDVSLGRYSTIIKPVSIPTSAAVNHKPFPYTVPAGENLAAIADKFHGAVAGLRRAKRTLSRSAPVAT